jgi:hypothetical protein
MAPMLVLLMAAAGRVYAQEIPREPRPAETERTPENDKESKSERDAEELRAAARRGFSGHISAEGFPAFEEDMSLHNKGLPSYVEPVDLQWERNPAYDARNPGKAPRYLVFRVNHQDGSRRALSVDDVRTLYQAHRPLVQTGAATQEAAWHEFTKQYSVDTVTHEDTSANRNWTEISDAVNLGNRRLDPKSTVIFNALPQQTGEGFVREQSRMKIGGNAKAWGDLNEKIRTSSGEFTSRVATKQDLLHELNSGTSNVVILYAHFDGQHLYMPDAHGGRGEPISVDEFRALKDRTGDSTVKERVVVLAVCSTAAKPAGGAVTGGMPASLVSLLLQKGIGRTVFATQFPYDARQIPDLMQRLSSGAGPRAGGGQLRQYVELLYFRLGQSSPETEGVFGE